MFKNIQIFNFSSTWSATQETVEAALGAKRFVECGASQERSVGWVEPRGEKHGALVESVGGQWILKLLVETRAVPASVVNRKTQDRVEQITSSTGRKPGKKETRDLKEDIRMELMPMAFTKQHSVLVWIDRAACRLVVEATTNAKADEVVTALVQSIEGFAVTPVQTNETPAAVMTIWLDTQEPPAGFTIDRDCKLKANDESQASVRYTKHALDIEEIRGHLTMGKTPEHLALTWGDSVSFILTEHGAIKGLKFLEVTLGNDSKEGSQSGFDTDIAIATGELCKLLPDLYEALGGVTASASVTEPVQQQG